MLSWPTGFQSWETFLSSNALSGPTPKQRGKWYQSSQPLRYSRRRYWLASGTLVTFRLGPSQ